MNYKKVLKRLMPEADAKEREAVAIELERLALLHGKELEKDLKRLLLNITVKI